MEQELPLNVSLIKLMMGGGGGRSGWEALSGGVKGAFWKCGDCAPS